AVAANDMAWDQMDQQFYLSVASANGIDANSITALNPQTGVLGASIATGSEPGKLAVSSDGSYLYAGLDSVGSVHRYTLPGLQSDMDIPLGSSGGTGPYYAIDVEGEPGSPRSVAVSRGVESVSPREQGGVLVYDDAVARPQSVPGFGPLLPGTIDSLVWNANGQTLYGIDTEGGSDLYTISASAAGLQVQTTSTAGGPYGPRLHFDATTGYLYGDGGSVIDPATNGVVGKFTSSAVQGGLSGNVIMVPDGKLNIAYLLGQTMYSHGAQGQFVIEAFDLTHFTFLGAIPVSVSGFPSKMIRWGSNGLAILTGDPYGRGEAGDGVYLVSGGFVTSPAP
ncbi:MAG: hypothetical protein M3Y50_05170, partial [Acidobacteriota bacterium]|nr:hypothetical protein [Acidobacteriota bacterium]